MTEEYELMIAGAKTDKQLPVTSPFDGSEIGSAAGSG